MKNSISKLILSLVLILTFGMHAEAQVAKKGEYGGLCAFSGKVLGMNMNGKAPAFMVAGFFGLCKNDAGSGIFHMNSFKCHYSIEVVQMPKTVAEGYCTMRDADGDTITMKGSAKGSLGGPSVAETRITNGTGKYKGITGSGGYKTTPAAPFEQGTFQGWSKIEGSYQIP